MSRAGSLVAPPPSRSPWQRLYSAVLERRRERWRRKATVLPRPAISVGNLHWGGGGKTPMVAAIARRLTELGSNVAILSRGYRRRGRGTVVVSRGSGGPPEVDWLTAGDEPHQLATMLPDVAVVVDSDRAAAAAAAISAGPVDLFVLDDAFSHVRVARDLDLLVFPASDPFAGARLLPGGRLREPLSAAVHADAVLLTGLEPNADLHAHGQQLANALAVHGWQGPAFGVGIRAALKEHDAERDREVVLVSGTARPDPVATTAARLGLEVREHLVFPDHHDYPARSLERIAIASRRHDARVVTTSKDRPKLEGRLELPVAEIRVEAVPEQAFWEWLERKLSI